MRAETFAILRLTLLGLTGLGCVAYALAAILTGRADPVAWYWPSALGLACGALIALASRAAGGRASRAATDELYWAVWGRAQGQAYWASMAIFALFAVLGSTGVVAWPVAVAAMGCLMGAAFLLLFVLNDLRMR